MPAPTRPHKSLILCFDGTGNKFSGTPADSNIVKIFSLLDRGDPTQCHYYQPGIGTYVETSSLAQKSTFGRIKSAYLKAKDEAIGTSFGEHVMAGYKFLMRYYESGDDIYFFGFSRGAYTARFLAELLDYIGLLTAGNEEMLRFAWKTFAHWQSRTEATAREKQKKTELFEFMKSFRETFSRPIDRIRFIGLFDCVNSVPQFESAWMSRTKFPYTAKTSAQIIRHAVSIDERRTKFRQDLMSEQRHTSGHHHQYHYHRHEQNGQGVNGKEKADPEPQEFAQLKRKLTVDHARFRREPQRDRLDPDTASAVSVCTSMNSATVAAEKQRDILGQDAGIKDESDVQDIQEVWFAGQHGDIGGGWPLGKEERRPASDLPLMWMIREARRAGLPLDESKVRKSAIFFDSIQVSSDAPVLQVEGEPLRSPTTEEPDSQKLTMADMIDLHGKAKIHDSLAFGGGLTFGAVCAWQIMEHLPFRRMDLQKDGSWKPISWPLPRGETRDMPAECVIHGSVIRRMQADENYRPGNLIVGGGGRGMRRAPASAGIGQWKVLREEGDLLGEVFVKVPS